MSTVNYVSGMTFFPQCFGNAALARVREAARCKQKNEASPRRSEADPIDSIDSLWEKKKKK